MAVQRTKNSGHAHQLVMNLRTTILQDDKVEKKVAFGLLYYRSQDFTPSGVVSARLKTMFITFNPVTTTATGPLRRSKSKWRIHSDLIIVLRTFAHYAAIPMFSGKWGSYLRISDTLLGYCASAQFHFLYTYLWVPVRT